MPFVLRFVQEFAVAERDAFMALEMRFAETERRQPDRPSGRRSQPYAGGLPTNTLIWEHEFSTLTEAQDALAMIEGDPEHEELFRQQAPFITRARTEIYQTLEL